VFDSDVYYIVFMIFFSISNGYVGTIAMMFGPKVVDPKYQEMTASFLIAFLVLGCGLGSIISAPVVQSL
jgi:equilibrative nucleoside transporter 1/2/3